MVHTQGVVSLRRVIVCQTFGADKPYNERLGISSTGITDQQEKQQKNLTFYF